MREPPHLTRVEVERLWRRKVIAKADDSPAWLDALVIMAGVSSIVATATLAAYCPTRTRSDPTAVIGRWAVPVP
jgi:hypothetical protein